MYMCVYIMLRGKKREQCYSYIVLKHMRIYYSVFNQFLIDRYLVISRFLFPLPKVARI